jgi:hypothetical protein
MTTFFRIEKRVISFFVALFIFLPARGEKNFPRVQTILLNFENKKAIKSPGGKFFKSKGAK